MADARGFFVPHWRGIPRYILVSLVVDFIVLHHLLIFSSNKALLRRRRRAAGTRRIRHGRGSLTVGVGEGGEQERRNPRGERSCKMRGGGLAPGEAVTRLL